MFLTDETKALKALNCWFCYNCSLNIEYFDEIAINRNTNCAYCINQAAIEQGLSLLYYGKIVDKKLNFPS